MSYAPGDSDAFQIGDKVTIPAHRDVKTNADGTVTVKDVEGVVTNPHDPTDMMRLNGDPVRFYVRVRIKDREYGYHEVSLRKVPC